MADSVESMIGAHFLTNNNLYETLKWISHIKLVPLQESLHLSQFKNLKESTITLLQTIDLRTLTFAKEDSVKVLYEKYFQLPEVEELLKSDEELQMFKERILGLITRGHDIGSFGSSINAITHLHGRFFSS